MLVLMVSFPFYLSIALAQTADSRGIIRSTQNNLPSIQDAGQSCIDRNTQTNALVDVIDNDLINILERLLRVLQAIQTFREFLIYSIDTYVMIQRGFGNEPAAVAFEKQRNFLNNPIGGNAGYAFHYLTTCRLPDQPAGDLVAGGELSLHGIGLCNLDVKIGKSNINLPVNGFSNIYSAIGCACIPGILFQLRKLQIIYQTHSCCVEQACRNGLSIESCDAELSETLCVFWGKGALFGALMGLVIGIFKNLVFTKLIEQYITDETPWIGTIASLINAPFRIQALMQSLQSLQNTFTEPTCSDLRFDDIRESINRDITNQNCRFEEIDLNGDGIAERLEYVCGP